MLRRRVEKWQRKRKRRRRTRRRNHVIVQKMILIQNEIKRKVKRRESHVTAPLTVDQKNRYKLITSMYVEPRLVGFKSRV